MEYNDVFYDMSKEEIKDISGGGIIGAVAGGLAGFVAGNVVGGLAGAITYAETGSSKKAMNAYSATVVAGTAFGATAGGVGSLVF